mmetsp:Transcript_3870/g.14274  ORF Transcript_3870/g.14274 Transcript_3870/m.14274 type:complete len:224 (+) Transcript_3870:2764-3435(+)
MQRWRFETRYLHSSRLGLFQLRLHLGKRQAQLNQLDVLGFDLRLRCISFRARLTHADLSSRVDSSRRFRCLGFRNGCPGLSLASFRRRHLGRLTSRLRFFQYLFSFLQLFRQAFALLNRSRQFVLPIHNRGARFLELGLHLFSLSLCGFRVRTTRGGGGGGVFIWRRLGRRTYRLQCKSLRVLPSLLRFFARASHLTVQTFDLFTSLSERRSERLNLLDIGHA